MDLIQRIALPFDLKQFTTLIKKYSLIKLPILSIDDLITMKKVSDRPQDREDVKTYQTMIKKLMVEWLKK